MENYVQTSLKQKDFHSFKTECNCYAHDLSVCFEKTEDEISLTFYDKNHCVDDRWSEQSFLAKLKKRISLAWRIITKGHVEFETDFGFKNDKHVKEFMDYMNETYEEMKK